MAYSLILSTRALRQGLLFYALAMANIAPSNCFAEHLMNAYQAAKKNDPQWAAAQASWKAGQEKYEQGLSGLQPNISLSANLNNTQTSATKPTTQSISGTTKGYTVQLTQPLFRWQNWVNYQQGSLQAASSEIQLIDARQTLILRFAQAYFDILVTQETMSTIQAQKKAATEQLTLAQKSFDAGTVTVTDIHEAQSRLDLMSAQEIQIKNDLAVKKYALRIIVGEADIGPFPQLRRDAKLLPPQPNDMTHWLESIAHNLSVQGQHINVELARSEVEKNLAAHLPTIDLVASHNNTQSPTINPATLHSATVSATQNTVVGFQLNWPLFQGGYQVSRDREALYNLEKTEAELVNIQRNSAHNIHQAYLGVINGLAQINALEAAIASSNAALKANTFGYTVGVRINIDVLNAQSQLAESTQKWTRARFDTLLAQLKLKAAVGELTENDLDALDTLFTQDGTPLMPSQHQKAT